MVQYLLCINKSLPVVRPTSPPFEVKPDVSSGKVKRRRVGKSETQSKRITQEKLICVGCRQVCGDVCPHWQMCVWVVYGEVV